MADNNEKIEIRLVARAELQDAQRMQQALRDVDSSYAKTEQALKKVETQARRTSEAVRSIPRSSQAFSGLASPPTASTLRSASEQAALDRAEREAGLATERAMRREAQIDQKINARAAAARQRQAEELQTAIDRTQAERDRRTRQTADVLNSQQQVRARNEAARNSSALDGVSPTRTQTVAAIAGTTAAVGVAAKAFKELADQQAASQELAAAMYDRGIASDDFFQRLHRVAEEMRKETGTKNADWLKVLADLVSAGANTQNIDQLAKDVENLAGLMNGNIPNAALAMEKAIQGNFETLSHWGISIPENATQVQKLESALKQLAERGAGLMESRSKTLAGQWDNLKNSGYNLLAALAGTFTHSELLKQSMNGLGAVMQKAAEWIGLPAAKLDALNSKLVQSSRALEDARNAAKKAAQEYGSIAKEAERAAQAMERQNKAEQAIKSAQDNIASARRDLQQAQIDAAVHSGAMSPQQGEIQSAALRLRYERERFQRDQQFNDDAGRAAAIRLGQLGNQRGLLTSEAASVQKQLEEFDKAHAARAELANAQNAFAEAQAKLSELRSRPTTAAIAAAGGEVGVMGPTMNPGDIAAAEKAHAEAQARLQAAQGKAGQFGITDEQGVALQERMAKLTTALQDLTQQIQKEQPGLQDTVGQSKLTHDANAMMFQLFQQTLGTQLNDKLSQTKIQGGNIAELRAALNDPTQEQLINALRNAIMLRNEAQTTGFTEIINAINADIRNINAQLKTLSVRR